MIQSFHFSAERKKGRDITGKRLLNAIGEIKLLRSGPGPGTITTWLYTEWLAGFDRKKGGAPDKWIATAVIHKQTGNG